MGTLSVGYSVTISAILGALVYLLMFCIKRLSFYKKASAFCGPPWLPILGNALHFVGNSEDILNAIMKFSTLYQSPFRIWLGPQLMVFVSEPEQIKTVLTSDKMIEKADIYKFYRPWLGHGLFSAPAKHWRVHRKLIGPTFNLKILESFVGVFVERAKYMVKRMEKELNGPDFEIFDYTALCTLEIICESAMGITMDENDKSNHDYVEAAEKVLEIVYKRIFKAWLHSDVIFNSTQLGKEQKKCIGILHAFTNAVIQKKRSALLDETSAMSVSSHRSDKKDSTSQRKAYLDHLMVLLDGDKKFSDSELREEVDTMIVAGNDTSSTVLRFVMLMLASHPDIQEKAYRELLEIYGDYEIDERDVKHEDLPQMEYMERVIKETLRIFPIGPIIARSATEDFDIDEYTIPKKTILVLNILAVQRSEKYWCHPLKFDPDRFLPQEAANRHSYCYLPFSAGPRNCIGSRFAMMELKTILATVLRRYILKKDNIVPISDIRLKTETMLKPVHPITLRIERR